MPEYQLNTPVAFIIFNRPDTTEQVFNEIAKAKPPKLLVVGDGSRTDRLGEAEMVAATRAIIRRVNWDCEVLVNFSEVNLGCKRRVSSGLDWIFDQVEEAIILEDDCLPDPTFFRFCEELLQHYRYDQRIGLISGVNFQFGEHGVCGSYYFTKYSHIWGWASWRDRWKSYDVTMAKWPHFRDTGGLAAIAGNQFEGWYLNRILNRVHQSKQDTWDFQWAFANWCEGRVNIVPARNLISNIGFGIEATHTTGYNIMANMPRSAMEFPLIHPQDCAADSHADRRTFMVHLRVALANRLNKLVSWPLLHSSSRGKA